MNGFILLYEKLLPDAGLWQPLLQHQAIVAVARAVLTHGTSVEPELSNDELFAPLNLDILPLLALVASDFADFAEPEATTRPRTPIRLYRDSSFEDGAGDVDGLRHLLHPAWFETLDLDLPGIIGKYHPKTCIIAGDPAQIAKRDGDLLASFNRIVHFRHLATRFEVSGAPLPGTAITADDQMDAAIAAGMKGIDGEPAPRSMWDTMLREGEAPQLEPFVPFGPALEMTTLTGDDGGPATRSR
jgi:hypothetical protein